MVYGSPPKGSCGGLASCAVLAPRTVPLPLFSAGLGRRKYLQWVEKRRQQMWGKPQVVYERSGSKAVLWHTPV